MQNKQQNNAINTNSQPTNQKIIYIKNMDDIETECNKLDNYIIYFCSNTCGPCNKLQAITESMLNTNTVLTNVTLVKIDIGLDSLSPKKEALKLIYNFKNIPHFKFYVRNITTSKVINKMELLAPTTSEYECAYKMIFNKLI